MKRQRTVLLFLLALGCGCRGSEDELLPTADDPQTTSIDKTDYDAVASQILSDVDLFDHESAAEVVEIMKAEVAWGQMHSCEYSGPSIDEIAERHGDPQEKTVVNGQEVYWYGGVGFGVAEDGKVSRLCCRKWNPESDD